MRQGIVISLSRATLTLCAAVCGLAPMACVSRSASDPVAYEIAELRDDDDVASLDFNPDGSRLAVGTFTTLSVNLWDWRGRSHIVRTLLKPPHSADFMSGDGVRFSPDGNWLAVTHALSSVADGSEVVRIFDASSGAVVHGIGEPLGGSIVSKIAFTPDGRSLLRLYGTLSKTREQLVVHRVDTWERSWGLSIAPLSGMSLAVSPRGDLAAIGGITLGPGVTHQAQIIIVDLNSRQIIRTIENAFPPENQVEQLAWSADGQQIAASGIVGGSFSVPDAVRVFDAASGEQVAGEPVKDSHGMGLRYTPDGRYLI